MTDILARMAKSKKSPEEAPEPTPGTGTVRIDADLARMLTVISIRRGESVAELLSPHIRSWVERLYKEVVQEMHDEITD